MTPLKVITLIYACIFIHESHGFTGSPSRSSITKLTPTIRGQLFASSKLVEVQNEDDIMQVITPEVIVDTDFVMQSEKQHNNNNNLRNKLTTLVAPCAALTALAVFSIPQTSNAIVLSDISSIAGGAAADYSQWIESLTGSGFYQAFSLVFLSEIGDKTFFVAALLAAKLSRFISFIGSLGALAVMTVISVIIGQVFHAVPSEIANGIPLDDVAAVIAFTYFGIKILSEALEAPEEGGKSAMDEEFEDAEEAVASSDTITKASKSAQVASIFALVFAAEFGDRSFLATIALSAAQNPVSVAAGAIAAHAIATGVAVIGGAYISKYVSEKVIGYIGGTLFLIFAVTTAIGIF